MDTFGFIYYFVILSPSIYNSLMRIIFLNKNDYIKYSKESTVNPLQTYAWGQLKKPNWYPIRLGVYKGKKIISVLTIFTRQIPFVGKKFGYIPRGVAVKDRRYTEAVLKKILGFTKELRLSHLMIDIEIDNSFENEDDKEALKKFKDLYESVGFYEGGRQEQPIRTVILDLSKTEQDLLADMKSKHRQYIRKAERNGVKVMRGDDASIDDFCKIIKEVIHDRGYVMHEIGYYKKVWQFFRQEDQVVMFVARVKGEVVGTYMIILSADNAYEMFGGCNKKGRNLLANYLLKWESIKYCKKIGKQYYDQWGAEFAHPGLVQFKEGFGGKVVEYPPQYVYVCDKLGYFIYKILRKINTLKGKVLNS